MIDIESIFRSTLDSRQFCEIIYLYEISPNNESTFNIRIYIKESIYVAELLTDNDIKENLFESLKNAFLYRKYYQSTIRVNLDIILT